MDSNDLQDYAYSNIEKVLARVPGVGEVVEFGAQYAMRVWLNPDKLIDYHMTMDDVLAALRAYNVEVSAGQFGGAPAVKLNAEGQEFRWLSPAAALHLPLNQPTRVLVEAVLARSRPYP